MKKCVSIFLAVVMTVALTACVMGSGNGVSQEEYDTLQDELSKLQQELDIIKSNDSGENNASNENKRDDEDNNPARESETPAPAIERGDMIEFGGHKWRVLEVQDGKALILSDRVLLERAYHHNRDPGITWAESDMRQYLNSAFIDDIFTTEEAARIAETIVKTDDNPWYGTPGGTETTDKVFLLSIEEVMQYFGINGQLDEIIFGGYIEEAYISDDYDSDRVAYGLDGNPKSWWLRSPGLSAAESNHAGLIATRIGENGWVFMSFLGGSGVRPALWLIL